MKSLLFLIMLIAPVFSFAQEKIITTEQEYNFLVDTYKIDSKTILPGYELKEVGKANAKNFEISHYYLNELSSNKIKAVLFVIKKEKGENDKIKYLCLPFNDKILVQKFVEKYESLGVSMSLVFQGYMMTEFSKLVQKL